MLKRRRFLSVLVGFLLVFITFTLILNIPYVVAAPSGEVEVEADNVLELGDSEEVVVTFRNTASTDVDDVASTIQFITLAAANLNPSRALIALNASWEIYESEGALLPRIDGNVTGTYNASAIYAPYSTTDTVYSYTWALGKPDGLSDLNAYTNSTQFADDLRILRPGEVLKLTITVECQDVVGDSRIWFFFQATEFEPTSIPVANITAIPEAQRMNLYYQDKSLPIRAVGWWPLHNSYDPYDSDINTGHVFEQVGDPPTYGWTRALTIRAFAKSNKLVHQKPREDPPEDSSFHICGVKFLDLDRDGVYDVDIEPGIDRVTITLLGADNATPAEEWYTEIEYSEPEENPLLSGENQLRGSYCFNMYNLTAEKEYIFYIREELPSGTVATSPTWAGPITLMASDEGPRESLNNHFGNAEILPPVGGEAYPADKTSILAPWIALAAAVIAGASVLVLRRRRA